MEIQSDYQEKMLSVNMMFLDIKDAAIYGVHSMKSPLLRQL